MFAKYYTATIVIKADDPDEATMVAETMASGTAEGAVIDVRSATETQAWAYDRLRENV